MAFEGAQMVPVYDMNKSDGDGFMGGGAGWMWVVMLFFLLAWGGGFGGFGGNGANGAVNTLTNEFLFITLSTTPTLTNLKRFCLVLAQSLPSGANTLPVQIQIGTTVYPVYTRTGNLLRADQIRCRRVYPIIFGSDPNHFSMLCCVPNTVYTPTAPTVPTVEVLED